MAWPQLREDNAGTRQRSEPSYGPLTILPGSQIDVRPRRLRPLCLLDIDGVIVLLGPGDGEPTFEAEVAGFPVTIALAARERCSRISTISRWSGLPRGNKMVRSGLDR